MKIGEIRNMADEELRQQISDKVDALFRLRVRSATERIENTAQVGNLRRDIARMKTVLRERVLKNEKGASAEA